MKVQIDIALLFFSLAMGSFLVFVIFLADRICRSIGDKRISKLSTLLYFLSSGWIGLAGMLGVWSKFDLPWWGNAIFYFSATVGSFLALVRLTLFIYLCIRDYRRWAKENYAPTIIEDREGPPGVAF
jgi:hypothetical protein